VTRELARASGKVPGRRPSRRVASFVRSFVRSFARFRFEDVCQSVSSVVGARISKTTSALDARRLRMTTRVTTTERDANAETTMEIESMRRALDGCRGRKFKVVFHSQTNIIGLLCNVRT